MLWVALFFALVYVTAYRATIAARMTESRPQ
jgi:hypothetical protein